jgi:hypothetical protein
VLGIKPDLRNELRVFHIGFLLEGEPEMSLFVPTAAVIQNCWSGFIRMSGIFKD